MVSPDPESLPGAPPSSRKNYCFHTPSSLTNLGYTAKVGLSSENSVKTRGGWSA